MLKIRGKYLLIALALLLPLLLAGLFLSPERLLDDWLRPRLAALAADKLSAEVSIGRLAWQDGEVLVSDITLEAPKRYQVTLPEVRIKLTLSGLLQGHISSLEAVHPHLLLVHSPDGGGAGLPARAPVSFGRLAIQGGSMTYRLSEKDYAVREIDFLATGGETYELTLAAMPGGDEAFPVRLTGQAEWTDGLALSLESFRWDGRELLAGPMDFTLPSGAGAAGGGRLRLARLDRPSLDRLFAGLSLKTGIPEGWNFILQNLDLRFSLAGNTLSLGVQVSSGGIAQGDLHLPFDALNLELSGTGSEWTGTLRGLLAQSNPFEAAFTVRSEMLEGQFRASSEDPGRLKSLLMGGEAPRLAGGLRMEGRVSGPLDDPILKLQVTGFPVGNGSRKFLFDLAPLRIQGAMAREKDGWRGKADLELADSPLAEVEGDLQTVLATFRPTSWQKLRPLLGPGLRDLLQQGQDIEGRLRMTRHSLSGWSGSARLGARRLQFSDSILAGPTVDLDFAIEKDHWAGSLSLRGKKLSFGNLDLEGWAAGSRWRLDKSRLLISDTAVDGNLTGYGGLSARFSLKGSGTRQAGNWHMDLDRLSLAGIEFFAADGLAGLAGGYFSGSGTVDAKPGAPLRLALRGDLGAAEGLWGRYYADLAAIPARLAVNLTTDPAKQRLELEHLRLAMPEMLLLQGTGTIARDSLNLSGELELPDLAGPVAEHLKEILGDSHSLLREARIGGSLRMNLAVADEGRQRRLRGEVFPHEVAFQAPGSAVALAGLTGNLPFEFTFGASERTAKGGERVGSLKYQVLQWGPVSMSADAVPIVSAPDRFTFPKPLVLQLAGGRMAIDRLEFGRDRSGFGFDGLFTIAGVDLETLSQETDLPLMAGSIDGDLGHIRYSDGVLQSEGEARIRVFGGGINVRNIRIDASSLAYLQIFANVDFSGIDLNQVTKTLSFGVMNGIVDGHIHDLRLFGATPARFSARIESRDEGKRNISVKALNNLAILSQGGLSAALSRGIYRFIDFYRYSRIGIVCELEKDVFYLRGTARPESDQYLVFGGFLPPKIDILAPPAAVSFSEMLKRLQRIERTERRQESGND